MKKLKSVLLIWGIVYLLITALMYGLGDWLVALPVYLRTLVLSGLMVFGLQYLVFPLLNRKKSKQ